MPRPRCDALAAVAAVATLGCHPSYGARPTGSQEHISTRAEVATDAAPSPRCDYDVRVTRPAALLQVAVHCKDFGSTVWRVTRELAPFTTGIRTETGLLPADSDGRFATERRLTEFEYELDLDRAARALDDFDLALSVGGSVLAPASSFLLRPDPAPAAVRTVVRVETGMSSAFATGLERDGDRFVLEAHELRWATYSVFGKFESKILRVPRFGSGSSEVETAWLDGAVRASSDDRARWVTTAVNGVADFYGGFPASRTFVALAPIPGKAEVLHGKLLPAGGDAIAVLVGRDAPQKAFARDWILVHELFHLGTPSFVGEGAWLDEGLATYVEPIIRARVGLLTEKQAWREITAGMERGRRLCETTGLENYGSDFRAVYWGGAVISLLADVEARRRSAGARGLEDGLRALLARGGDARTVWVVEDAIKTIDSAIGSPVLAELSAKYRYSGHSIPLDQVLSELGVVRAPGGVELRKDAPLANIRRAIVWGAHRAQRTD